MLRENERNDRNLAFLRHGCYILILALLLHEPYSKGNSMKKFIAIAVLYAGLITAACTTGGASGGGAVPLDQAIQEAARNIEDAVQEGQKIAVLNFSSPTPQFSEYGLYPVKYTLLSNGT